ncbi:hypothetical protein ACIA03_04005 [Nocardioides sp. NPDC051685]|uniref:hypothetical protein n=1 Tax=Nocardioides sp. NPDC051685 TaxID=3364334 RepID=UPI0037B69627
MVEEPVGDRRDGLLEVEGVSGVEDPVEVAECEHGLSLFGAGRGEGQVAGADGDRPVLDRILLGDRSSDVGLEQGGGLGDHPFQLPGADLVGIRSDLLVDPRGGIGIEPSGQVGDPPCPPGEEGSVQDPCPHMLEPVAQFDCVPEELLPRLRGAAQHRGELDGGGFGNEWCPRPGEGQHPVPEPVPVQPRRLSVILDRVQRREPRGSDQHVPVSLFRDRPRRTHRGQQIAAGVVGVEECFHARYFTKSSAS